MNTIFWGPSGWEFLHAITAIYPVKPSLNDKILMRDFMLCICSILPCKYCRVSFTNYSNTLDIIPYLESNNLMQEWIYKMHIKVNNKLRHQGYCTTKNPELEDVKNKYIKLVINKIENIYKQIILKTIKPQHAMKNICNYICNLGYNFIGSIVFNYQAYYANCHTSDEKLNIIYIHNKFFNILQLLICNYILKHNPTGKMAYDACATIKKINIKKILIQNESYTKFKQWFYNYSMLCNITDKTDGTDGTDTSNDNTNTNTNKDFKNYDDFENYFNKHIVSSCATPSKNNIVNSCRKRTKTNTKRY